MVAPLVRNAIGTPDFGANIAGNPSAPVFDPGEVANRILQGGGSMSRSGRWIFATGFEAGSSPVEFILSNTAPTIGNASGVYQGNSALYMTTNGVINNHSTAAKFFFSSISPGRWGIEMMLSAFARDCRFEISLNTSGLVAGGSSSIRVNIPTLAANMTFQYQSSVGSYIDFLSPGANFSVGAGHYHNLKLVVDFTTLQYVRFEWNGNRYPLTGLAMNPAGAGSTAEQVAIIDIESTAAAVNTAVVDNLILTADEV